MTMVLAETLLCFLILLVGVICLYVSFQRKEAIIWPFLSVVLFLVGTLYSYSIPFSVNASGAVIGTSTNVVLSGVNLMFAFLSLLWTINIAFRMFLK
jgi:hypothetical protein